METDSATINLLAYLYINILVGRRPCHVKTSCNRFW